MTDSAQIHIWRFHDAPEDLKELSEHGGDEDWIALIDNEFKEENGIPFFLETSPFAVCDYTEHEYGDYTVIISSHS